MNNIIMSICTDLQVNCNLFYSNIDINCLTVIEVKIDIQNIKYIK